VKSHNVRITYPSGIVPDLKEFTRHLWTYRGEDGLPVISPPPIVYTLTLDPGETDDIQVIAEEVARLKKEFEVGSRVEPTKEQGVPRVHFRDVEALHMFVRLLAIRAGTRYDHVAREMGDWIMHTLGIDWV